MKKSVMSAAGSIEMSGASRWLAAWVLRATGGTASAAASATTAMPPSARGNRMVLLLYSSALSERVGHAAGVASLGAPSARLRAAVKTAPPPSAVLVPAARYDG